jgi:EmrB/QacA subfamily drug resistance transporter
VVISPGSPDAAATPSRAAAAHETLGEPLPTRWIAFAVVAAALLMVSIDQTSVATALSALQADLGAPLAWSAWTITASAVGQIVAMPLGGRLSEQFGRRRVLLTAVAVFTLMSLLCGFAANIGQLIACRLVQGLAAGAVLPSATGIVADQFGRDRDRAVGMFTSIFPIGAIIGPVIGGLIVSTGSWRGIFLVNVPIGLVLLGTGLLTISESSRRVGGRIDVRGIVLLVATLLPFMYGVTRLGTLGDGWVGPVSAAAAGAVAAIAGWMFFRHARRHPAPVVPMRLIRGPQISTLNLMNFLLGAALVGCGALVPHYAETRYGIAPLLAGGLLTFRAIGMIGTSGIAVWLLRRTGHRPLLLTGLVLLTIGLVLLAMPPIGLAPMVWLAVAAAVTGLGMGLAMPAANNAGMHLVPDQISAVSGLRGMFRQTGGIIGISITTAAVTSSPDQGVAQAIGFAALAGVLLAAFPLALRIPNQRGRW